MSAPPPPDKPPTGILCPASGGATCGRRTRGRRLPAAAAARVVALIGAGWPNRRIAAAVGTTWRTVGAYRRRLGAAPADFARSPARAHAASLAALAAAGWRWPVGAAAAAGLTPRSFLAAVLLADGPLTPRQLTFATGGTWDERFDQPRGNKPWKQLRATGLAVNTRTCLANSLWCLSPRGIALLEAAAAEQRGRPA